MSSDTDNVRNYCLSLQLTIPVNINFQYRSINVIIYMRFSGFIVGFKSF